MVCDNTLNWGELYGKIGLKTIVLLKNQSVTAWHAQHDYITYGQEHTQSGILLPHLSTENWTIKPIHACLVWKPGLFLWWRQANIWIEFEVASSIFIIKG